MQVSAAAARLKRSIAAAAARCAGAVHPRVAAGSNFAPALDKREDAEPSARLVRRRRRMGCGFRFSEAFYERHGHEDYDEDQGQGDDYGGGLERAQPAQDEQSDGDES